MMRGNRPAAIVSDDSDSTLPCLCITVNAPRAVEVSAAGVTIRTTFENGIDMIVEAVQFLDFDDIKYLALRMRGSKLAKAIIGQEK